MWSVKAKPRRDGREGFRRDGIFFRCDEPTILEDDRMTDAIRNEPMLLVEPFVDVLFIAEEAAELGEAVFEAVEHVIEAIPTPARARRGRKG